ncbi:alpha/beta fold hydrolase, partial [Streptococcus pyogenes]
TIDGRWGPRQVHYRRSGQGPALVLLHQSPQSSRELAALMQRWSVHFTLIAPDTPGYGQSDPLGPASLGIADFAEALGEFVDAI